MNNSSKHQIMAQLIAINRKLIQLYGNAYAKAINLQGVINAVEAGEDDFDWEKHPDLKKQVEQIMTELTANVSKLISTNATTAYDKSAKDSSKAIVKSVGGYNKALSKGAQDVMDDVTEQHRDKAKETAKQRGIEISTNVWNYNESSKKEIQIIIQNGIKQGMGAAEMTNSLKGYLQNPDTLFRRVRNKETGELELSDAAKNYHPGRGVYRSAYKNALRLARTEVNMAYRQAEWQTYQNNPLIKAYRIQLSNNHTTENPKGGVMTLTDICDRLQGVYPKTFKWTGWHPQCRCTMIPLTLSTEEFGEYSKAKRDGKVEQWELRQPAVNMPKNFTDWVDANKERIQSAKADGKSIPYFIKDNYKDGDIDKGLAIDVMSDAERILRMAQARHDARTPEQVKNIKDKWAEHKRIEEEIKKIQAQYSIPYYEGKFAAEIESCKSIKELNDFLSKNGVTNTVSLGKMNLESAKTICKVAAEMQERFSLRAIDIVSGGTKRGRWYMRAHGGHVEVNAGYWEDSEINNTLKTGFYDSVSNFVTYKKKTISALTSNITYFEDRLNKAKAAGDKVGIRFWEKEIKKANTTIGKLQKIIDSGINRFNQFLSRETMLRDCYTHETGHVIHDQILGGINGATFRRKRYDVAEANKMNDELKALYKKYKDGDKWITEYGITNDHEFLSESMVLYMYNREKLPTDMQDWFERLEKMAHGGTIPKGKEISYQEAYKKYMSGEDKQRRINEAAEKRHADTNHRNKVEAMAKERERMKGVLDSYEGLDTQTSEIINGYHKAIANGFDTDELKRVLDNAETTKEKLSKEYQDYVKRLDGVKDLGIELHRKVIADGKMSDMYAGKDFLKDRIYELEHLTNVRDGLANAKKYSYKEVLESDAEITKVFKDLNARGLDDRYKTIVNEWTNAKNDILKKAYKDKMDDVFIDVKVRDLTPIVSDGKVNAQQSLSEAYKHLFDDAEDALNNRDWEKADKLIKQANKVKPIVDRYDEMKKYAASRKSGIIDKALNDAEKAMRNGDYDAAEESIKQAENRRSVNEKSSASKKEARKNKKNASNSTDDDIEIILPEVDGLGGSLKGVKSYEDIEKRMGSNTPIELRDYNASVKRESCTNRKYLDKANRPKLESAIEDWFDSVDFGHWEQVDVLGSVADNGILGTLQTGSSNGANFSGKTIGKIEPDHGRLMWAHWAFEGKQKGKYARRPIPEAEQWDRADYYRCGTCFDKDMKVAWDKQSNWQYGDVQIRFKKDKVITTFTYTNSLGSNYVPSLTCKPNVVSLDDRPFNPFDKVVKGGKIGTPADFQYGGEWGNYMELQYHVPAGKKALSIDMMESIVVPNRPDTLRFKKFKRKGNFKDYEIGDQDYTNEVWEKYYEAGVDVYYHDNKTGKIILWKKGKQQISLTKEQMKTVKGTGEDLLRKADKWRNADDDPVALERALKSKDYESAYSILAKIRDNRESFAKESAKYKDLIPDIDEQHKSFTFEDLRQAHSAIKSTLDRFDSRYGSDPDKLIEKIKYEISYVENPSKYKAGAKKHSTWKISQDALKRKLDETIGKYKSSALKDDYIQLKGYLTKSKDYAEILSKIDDGIKNGHWSAVEDLVVRAKEKKLELQTLDGNVALKVGQAIGVNFSEEDFSIARKSAAIMFKDSNVQDAYKKADDYMSKYAQDVWGKLSEEEKHVAWLYTTGSRYITETFTGTYCLQKVSQFDGSVRNGAHDINILTTAIGKCPKLKEDMIMQHAQDLNAFRSQFGIDLAKVADLAKLVGKEGANNVFTSCSAASDGAFTKDVTTGQPNDIIMNIYLPKGTQGMYVEPFAAWGDSKRGVEGMNWDGKKRRSKPSDQIEYILQRGAKFRITGAHYDNSKKKWIIDVDLIGQKSVDTFK